MQTLSWVIGIPVVLVILTRGWTPPAPRKPREPRPPQPSTEALVEGFYERIASNAEMTRAVAAADQASLVACRSCGRNHFGPGPDDEPGARVVDGRTGELVGYWRPRE
jgi:hypothetical protein